MKNYGRLKILILSSCQGRIFGGYENWVDNISIQLAKLGFYVHIVTGPNNLNPSHPRIHFHKFPIIGHESMPIKKRPFNEIAGWIETTSLTFNARKFLSRNKWDVILIAAWTDGYIFKLFLPISGKTIYTFHTTPLPWLKLLFEPLKDADVVTVTSHYVADYVDELYGIKAEVIPIGVDLERFNPSINCKGIRNNLNIGKKDVMILFVGRLEKKKGVWTLLKATSKLPENIHTVFVGTGTQEIDLKMAAKGMKNIHITGKVENSVLPKMYAAADIVCVPSEYEESSGSIQMEAMASGKPVIVSNSGGLAETVQKEYQFKAGDWKELRNKLIDLASNNNKRKRLGRIGRQRAIKLYDWDKIGQRYVKIISDLK